MAKRESFATVKEERDHLQLRCDLTERALQALAHGVAPADSGSVTHDGWCQTYRFYTPLAMNGGWVIVTGRTTLRNASGRTTHVYTLDAMVRWLDAGTAGESDRRAESIIRGFVALRTWHYDREQQVNPRRKTRT